MIHKLISIKNLGKYFDYNTTRDSDWNGIFEKINVIYAENASGKTTFTQLLKSLNNSEDVIIRRKSFNSDEKIQIKMIYDNNKQLEFNNNRWNKHFNNIEIFDSYFIEENVYLISIGNYDKEGNLFQLVMGEDAKNFYDEIISLIKIRKNKNTIKRRLRNKLKKETNQIEQKKIQSLIDKRNEEIQKLLHEIDKLEKGLFAIAEEFGTDYLNKINHYLSFLNPALKLEKLNKKGNNFIYHLRINSFEVRSDSESIPLKHTLSEGDKSSLALAFFLAKITINNNLEDKIIVFDDPISSFDYNRRNITINQLNIISKKCKQFFLLSHDINFIRDFSLKVENCLNLKIISKQGSSIFKTQNIKYETLNGIFKDLTVIKDYIDKTDDSEFNKRDVIRCIRPVIEGFFRIKFFGIIDENQWLGDIISQIRDCDSDSSFYKYKIHLDEIIDINDYTKTYHHSNPNYLEIPINSAELKNYSQRTIQLLYNI